MMIQLIRLEEEITKNYAYVSEIYPDVEVLLVQVRSILDHGVNADVLSKWWQRNSDFIQRVQELLDNREHT